MGGWDKGNTSWRRISQSEIRKIAAAESEGGAGIHFPHTPFSSRPARAKIIKIQRPDFRGKKFVFYSRQTADRICPSVAWLQILSAAELKQQQTFEIILPNLIHKSKKRNLKKK